jgi:hypothetical protein
MTIDRREVFIEINSINFKVCSLNFDLKNNQFYYHFAYPKKAKEKLWYETLQRETGRPDHISFHQSGQAHLALKKGGPISVQHFNEHAFIPHNQDIITPLLVHSIYIDQINNLFYLPQYHEPSSNCKNTLLKPCSFSVIIFLSPEKFTADYTLNQIEQFLIGDNSSTEWLLGNPAGRIIAWKGWAIDYIISDLTLQIPPNKYHSAFAYHDLHLIFRSLISQRLLPSEDFFPHPNPPKP